MTIYRTFSTDIEELGVNEQMDLKSTSASSIEDANAQFQAEKIVQWVIEDPKELDQDTDILLRYEQKTFTSRNLSKE